MPSPRAVLADIAEFKLDPKVAHVVTHSSGRLGKPATKTVVAAKEPPAPKPAPSPAPPPPPVKKVEVVAAPPVKEVPPVLSPITPPTVVTKVKEAVVEVKVKSEPTLEVVEAEEKTEEAAKKKAAGNKKVTADKA